MVKKISLFRLTLDTDTSSTSDRIDFNDPANPEIKDSKKENAWISEGIEIIGGEGIGDDQPAESDLGSVDALGSVEYSYTLQGKITKTDGDSGNGQNQFLILLDLWSAEPKKNDNWGEGRFGIIDDNDHTNDLIPVGTGNNQIGLIWESYTKKQNLAKNQTEITLKFRVSRGDGT